MSSTESTESIESTTTYSQYHKRSYIKNSAERKRKALVYYHANREAQNLKNKERYRKKRAAVLKLREEQKRATTTNE